MKQTRSLSEFTSCPKLPYYIYADVSSVARGLKFGLSLYHDKFFVSESSEDRGEAAHLRRLAWAVVS